jgi:hypothetical protein
MSALRSRATQLDSATAPSRPIPLSAIQAILLAGVLPDEDCNGGREGCDQRLLQRCLHDN